MLEHDYAFTPEMRKLLKKEFNIQDSPAEVAQDADAFVRSLDIPTQLEKRPIEMPRSIDGVLSKRLFTARFVEEHFSEEITGNRKTQAENFLSDFNDWKDMNLEYFKQRNDMQSRRCVRIMEIISLDNVHDFIQKEAKRYKSHLENSGLNYTRYSDAREKSKRWGTYAEIARFAVILNQTRATTPRK